MMKSHNVKLLRKNLDCIRAYIISLPDDELSSLTVAKLAWKLSYNRTYLSTVFKEYTGISLIRFITDTKLNRAMVFLMTPGSEDFSTREISKRFGYPQVDYFSRLFKKRFLIAPNKFRKLFHGKKTIPIPNPFLSDGMESPINIESIAL